MALDRSKFITDPKVPLVSNSNSIPIEKYEIDDSISEVAAKVLATNTKQFDLKSKNLWYQVKQMKKWYLELNFKDLNSYSF